MSWTNIKEFTFSALDPDGDAVAFFMNEKHCDEFIKSFNNGTEDEELHMTKGQYIDVHADIIVRGS